MAGSIEGMDRCQTALFPDRLEDWIGEDSPVRVVVLFVDEPDLPGLGFGRAAPARTGRPGSHQAGLLMLFIHGYPNRIASSRRLERAAESRGDVADRPVVPEHKTVAEVRR